MCGRATITLGIGPHSSFGLYWLSYSIVVNLALAYSSSTPVIICLYRPNNVTTVSAVEYASLTSVCHSRQC